MPDKNSEKKSARSAEDQISYESINFTDQAGFKPMMAVGILVLISFVLLSGLPQYAEPGDGSLTIYSYTVVVWGVVIAALGFLYEFWLMKIEGGVW